MEQNYKQLYKANKYIKGTIHPTTLYYWFRNNPLLLPYIVIYPIIAVVAYLFKAEFNFFTKKLYKKRIKTFISKNQNKKVSDFIKPIALYLPQFHEIPENNEWWGQGFTEWTNVKKAKPLYEGHYQPHIPHPDIGYYDLADINVMKKQAKMAKDYGIFGFCFYYYHFKDKKRLLEKPVNNYINAKEIDFPFCFAWANENWTRTWDGGEKNIIMHQDYDEENMLNLIKEMIPAFSDNRYIKHNGCPVLLIYRPEIIPQIKNISDKWRSLIKEAGFDNLYLISMQNFTQTDPSSMGFDAATEFAPRNHQKNLFVKNKITNIFEGNYLRLINYKNILKTMNFRKEPSYIRYKAVCPSWDNSPRRKGNFPTILYNTTKELFDKFYKNAIIETLTTKANNTGYLFINAWNEWAEGTHLEPDEKYGYTNLEVIKSNQDKDVKDIYNG